MDLTVAVANSNINDLLRRLKKKSESAVDWFKHNHMNANPDKSQVIM